MTQKIAERIKITVTTDFLLSKSQPVNLIFIFSYKIRIENRSEVPVQLLNRIWKIWDSSGAQRTVAGEGVVGVQPLILSGTYYEYDSFCQLETEMGNMRGSYTFQCIPNQELFEVEIPVFQLVVPTKMN